ncbi:hypothetical protein [Treponema sp. R80B11-R83G3]
MANKKIWLGILVMVFGFFLTGCELFADKGYSFEIAVENNTNNTTWIITQIDFINGNKQNDPVLRTETVNLTSWQVSEYYKVSGFNSYPNDHLAYCGIKVYYTNGRTGFGSGRKKNFAKFKASALSITSPPSVIIYDDF